jgi:hypothetical protein
MVDNEYSDCHKQHSDDEQLTKSSRSASSLLKSKNLDKKFNNLIDNNKFKKMSAENFDKVSDSETNENENEFDVDNELNTENLDDSSSPLSKSGPVYDTSNRNDDNNESIQSSNDAAKPNEDEIIDDIELQPSTKEAKTASHPNRSANNTIDTSLLSSSSSSSSASLSPNLKSSSSSSLSSQGKPFPLGLHPNEWYKQYEDRFFNHRNAVLAAASGLHSYLKPPTDRPVTSSLSSPSGQSSSQSSANSSNPQIQSSPISNSSQATPLSDSSLLMERFYSNVPNSANLSSSPFANILKSQSGAQNDPQAADKLLAASHQALLAQYAQQFYLNGQNGSPGQPGAAPGAYPNMAAMMAAAAHGNTHFLHSAPSSASNPAAANTELLEKERERYLASLYHQHQQGMSPFGHHAQPHHFPHPQFGHFNRNQNDSTANSSSNSIGFSHQNSQRQIMESGRGGMHHESRNGRRNSSGSRSPSPSSSQHSGGDGCEDEDQDIDDSQSINAANGEWTYEEQFKQVIALV